MTRLLEGYLEDKYGFGWVPNFQLNQLGYSSLTGKVWSVTAPILDDDKPKDIAYLNNGRDHNLKSVCLLFRGQVQSPQKSMRVFH